MGQDIIDHLPANEYTGPGLNTEENAAHANQKMKRGELIGATPMTDFDNQSGESDRKFKPGRSTQMKRLALCFMVSIAVFHLPS